MAERELVYPVDLCTDSGRLNPAAVGWCRTPLVTANLRGRGRNKRWEYWGVQSAEAFIGITISDLDYATLLAVHAFVPGSHIVAEESVQFFRQLPLPNQCTDEAISVEGGGMLLSVTSRPNPDDATDLVISVRSKRVDADITVVRPNSRDSLGVVVPWGTRRFQYTVKDVGIPAYGRLVVDGAIVDLPAGGTFATRDFGRGAWPYRITWNWGVGVGQTADDRTLALQLGGKWTDGTGSTENGVFLDGRLTKISDELTWSYDRTDWMQPWRVRDSRGAVDLTFTPERVRTAKTEFGVLGSRARQAFGTWAGRVVVGSDEYAVSELRGWAEEVRNRW